MRAAFLETYPLTLVALHLWGETIDTVDRSTFLLKMLVVRRSFPFGELLGWKQLTALGVWNEIFFGVFFVFLKWSESYGRYVLKLCFFVVKQWSFIVTKISDFLLTWSSLGLFHDIPLGTTPSSSLRPGWQLKNWCWKENYIKKMWKNWSFDEVLWSFRLPGSEDAKNFLFFSVIPC